MTIIERKARSRHWQGRVQWLAGRLRAEKGKWLVRRESCRHVLGGFQCTSRWNKAGPLHHARTGARWHLVTLRR